MNSEIYEERHHEKADLRNHFYSDSEVSVSCAFRESLFRNNCSIEIRVNYTQLPGICGLFIYQQVRHRFGCGALGGEVPRKASDFQSNSSEENADILLTFDYELWKIVLTRESL